MKLIGGVTYTLAFLMPSGATMHVRAEYGGGSLVDRGGHHVAGGIWYLPHRLQLATRTVTWTIDQSALVFPIGPTRRGVLTIRTPWYVVPGSGTTEYGGTYDDNGVPGIARTRDAAVAAWLDYHRNLHTYNRRRTGRMVVAS